MDIEEYFAHWFKNAAEVGRTPADGYEDRKKAILALTKDMDRCDALNLVRIFCDVTNNRDDAISKFANYFKEVDGFDVHDVPFVFQVLSAISLIQILARENDTSADAIAVALSARTFQWQTMPLETEAVSADLRTVASRYLREESRRMRRTSKFANLEELAQSTEINLKALKKQVEQAGTNPLTLSDAESLLAAVNNSILTLDTRLSSLVERVNKTFDQFHRSLEASREETNIVWWLVGGWSNDLKRPYAGLTERQACLAAGKELSDLITLMPTDDSVKGFLHRILSLTQNDTENIPISIKDAVISAPDNWDLSWLRAIADSALIDFCPIHFSLLKNDEAADGSWTASFEKRTGINPTTQFLPVEISYQFCQERLLFRIAENC